MTFRPNRLRLMAVATATVVAVIFLSFWISLGPKIRAKFEPLDLITLALLAVLAGVVLWGLSRSKVVLRSAELQVVNGYRSRVFPLQSVVAVSLPVGAPWALADLSDGTQISLLGIQATDGANAAAAVAKINQRLQQPDD